jgi:hypothetical protein
MRIGAILCMAMLVAVCGPAARAAAPINPCALPPENNHLVADATETGVISLRFYNADGARVAFYECVRGRPQQLGSRRVDPDPDTNPPTTLKDAATWSCDRLVRRFVAMARLPDGSLASGAYSVRTVSCAQRFELSVPGRIDPGAKARIRVLDRWALGGIRPQLCITPPRGERACRKLVFPRAVSVAAHRMRASTRGRWRVELRVRGHRVRTFVAVGGGTRASDVTPPTVLATGDSTMQGIDSFLTDELGEAATVRSDVQPGSQISRDDYWIRHAESQTKRLRQRVTVISVGAATDALPLQTPAGAMVDCCDEPWVLAYSRRVRAMMRTYLRGGRGRVFWLTPPLPRYPPRAKITNAINEAILHAAEGLAGVTIARVDLIFSPDGYRDVMRYRGRDVRVRESDGVHLNIPGTAIVAKLLAPKISAALTAPASRSG